MGALAGKVETVGPGTILVNSKNKGKVFPRSQCSKEIRYFNRKLGTAGMIGRVFACGEVGMFWLVLKMG